MKWQTSEERCGRRTPWYPYARERTGFDGAAEQAARSIIEDTPKPSIDARSLLQQRAQDQAEIARLRAEVERLSSSRVTGATSVPTEAGEAFRYVMSVEFAASLTPTSSASILVRELVESPAVKALARGLTEEGNLLRLRSSVSRMVQEHLQKGVVFAHWIMLSAVAVALMHNRDRLADQYLEELSSLSNTVEFSEASRIALEVLRVRRAIPTDRR